MNFRFWNKKTEDRSADIPTEQPSINLTETSTDAIGLIFGNYSTQRYAQNLSAVYRATNLIANSLASLPIILYKTDVTGNKNPYIKHPVYKILSSRPNKFLTIYDWIKVMSTDMMLKGNAYSIIHRDPNGKIDHLEHINATKVAIVKRYNKDNELSEVLYNVSGKKRLYQDYEMIHLKMNLDEDGITGISILQFAQRSINLAHSNENAVQNSFENGGRLSGIVSVAGALTNKQRDDMRKAWKESLGGQNAGGIAIMSGLQKYESISQTGSEMELLGSRKFGISEIARFWEVSPILLYDLEKSNFNSAEQAHLSLLTDTLSQYIYKFECELENKLLSDSELEKCEIKFNTTEFLRADSKTRIEFLRTAFGLGIYSVNEMRGILDLPAIEDADEHYLQAQLVTLKNSKHLAEQQLDNNVLPKDGEDKNKDDENNE